MTNIKRMHGYIIVPTTEYTSEQHYAVYKHIRDFDDYALLGRIVERYLDYDEEYVVYDAKGQHLGVRLTLGEAVEQITYVLERRRQAAQSLSDETWKEAS